MALTLTVRQPWAWLIVSGHKDIENREWTTNLRGKLLIHAGIHPVDKWDLFEIRREFGIKIDPADLKFGGIIGSVDVVDCVKNHASRWFSGPIGWVLANPRPLRFRACRGMPGLFHARFAA